jgi:predicted O-methyltransferase YrrM
MKIDLTEIQEMVPLAMQKPNTGDPWLDNRIQEDIPVIGHTQEYYVLFHMIAKRFLPGLTVELGSYWATAASAFASPSLNNRVITIDIHREDQRARQKSVEAAAHYPNLTYLNGWTWDQWVVDEVKNTGRPIDILFIDAWHWYEHAIREWNLYSPILADEALVICDDIFDAAGTTVDMSKFWEEVSSPYERFVNTGLHAWIPMGFIHFKR